MYFLKNNYTRNANINIYNGRNSITSMHKITQHRLKSINQSNNQSIFDYKTI